MNFIIILLDTSMIFSYCYWLVFTTFSSNLFVKHNCEQLTEMASDHHNSILIKLYHMSGTILKFKRGFCHHLYLVLPDIPISYKTCICVVPLLCPLTDEFFVLDDFHQVEADGIPYTTLLLCLSNGHFHFH